MQDWYMTREGARLIHRGIEVTTPKKIFLNEAQAKLHGDKVTLSTAPDSPAEAALLMEFEHYQQAFGTSKKSPIGDKKKVAEETEATEEVTVEAAPEIKEDSEDA